MIVLKDHAKMELLVWIAWMITIAPVWLDSRERIADLKLNQNMIKIKQNFNDKNLLLKI